MKKILLVLTSAITLFAFSSCKEKAEPISLNKSYTCEAEITFGDIQANAGINRLGNGVWDIELTSPSNLAGLAICYDNELAKISYNGLSFEIAKEDLPIQSMLTALTQALDNAANENNINCFKKGNKITAEGKLNNGEYTITIDEKSGAMLNLTLPDLNLDVNFSKYKVQTT